MSLNPSVIAADTQQGELVVGPSAVVVRRCAALGVLDDWCCSSGGFIWGGSHLNWDADEFDFNGSETPASDHQNVNCSIVGGVVNGKNQNVMFLCPGRAGRSVAASMSLKGCE